MNFYFSRFRERSEGETTKKITLIAVGLIIIFGFAVYGNSINGKFIWDDNILIKNNIFIKSFRYLPKVFVSDLGAGAGGIYNFYRPLFTFTYLVNYTFSNFNVRAYHVTNIILHIIVSLTIFYFITLLYDDKLLSLLTSLLFLVHPVHTEAISYISGRAEPLASLFMLLCFIFYIKSIEKDKIIIYILSTLCYMLALLSKENSLILPALFLLYHYVFRVKFELKKFLPILIITLIYIMLRITALRSLLPNVQYTTALSQRIPGFFVAITRYVKILIFPRDLHMEYGNKLFSLTDPMAISGIFITLSFLFFAFKKRKDRLLSFSIFWFFIALLPYSNIYPINAYMAEHWLYLSSLGFFLILAKGLHSILMLKKLKVLAISSMIIMLLFYSYLTIKQNIYWQEPLSFYLRTLEYAPKSTRLYNNLGNTYEDMGNIEEAIKMYKISIEIDPNFDKPYFNLGNIYKDKGIVKEAILLYKKAIEINPRYADAYNNLGIIYGAMGINEKAITLFKKAIEINPYLVNAYYNLGVIYKELGKDEEASALLKKAGSLGPLGDVK